MKGIFAKTADMIWERGAFELKSRLLKGHENNPNEPLSPYFFNLRDENNPKPGPLRQEDFDLIAWCLWDVAAYKSLNFQAIAGIPRAGEPIAEAMVRSAVKPRGFRVIPLDKVETAGGRLIIPKEGFEYRPGEFVLLVDDLITGGDSKFEAIRAVKFVGALVRDLIVLIDRQQGGRKQLEQADCRVHCAFTAKELIGYYLAANRISLPQYEECMEYLNHFLATKTRG